MEKISSPAKKYVQDETEKIHRKKEARDILSSAERDEEPKSKVPIASNLKYFSYFFLKNSDYLQRKWHWMSQHKWRSPEGPGSKKSFKTSSQFADYAVRPEDYPYQHHHHIFDITANEKCLLREILLMFLAPSNCNFFVVSHDGNIDIRSETKVGAFTFLRDRILPEIQIMSKIRNFLEQQQNSMNFGYSHGFCFAKVVNVLRKYYMEIVEAFACLEQKLAEQEQVKEYMTFIAFTLHIKEPFEKLHTLYNLQKILLKHRMAEWPQNICWGYLMAELMANYAKTLATNQMKILIDFIMNILKNYCHFVDGWLYGEQFFNTTQNIFIEDQQNQKTLNVPLEVLYEIKNSKVLDLFHQYHKETDLAVITLFKMGKMSDLLDGTDGLRKTIYEEVVMKLLLLSRNGEEQAKDLQGMINEGLMSVPDRLENVLSILPFNDFLIEIIKNVLEKRSKLINSFLLKIFFREKVLLTHLGNITDVFLLRNDRIVQRFNEIFGQLMDTGDFNRFSRKLEKSLMAQTYPAKAFQVSLNQNLKEKLFDNFDLLSLGYELPEFLESYIEPKEYFSYNKLFNLLIKLKWSKEVLEKLSPKQMEKKMKDLNSSPSRQQRTLTFQLYQIRSWFLNCLIALQFYLNYYILRSFYENLERHCKELKTINGFKAVHEKQLMELLDRCLLDETNEKLSEVWATFFDSIRSFLKIWNNFSKLRNFPGREETLPREISTDTIQKLSKPEALQILQIIRQHLDTFVNEELHQKSRSEGGMDHRNPNRKLFLLKEYIKENSFEISERKALFRKRSQREKLSNEENQNQTILPKAFPKKLSINPCSEERKFSKKLSSGRKELLTKANIAQFPFPKVEQEEIPIKKLFSLKPSSQEGNYHLRKSYLCAGEGEESSRSRKLNRCETNKKNYRLQEEASPHKKLKKTFKSLDKEISPPSSENSQARKAFEEKKILRPSAAENDLSPSKVYSRQAYLTIADKLEPPSSSQSRSSLVKSVDSLKNVFSFLSPRIIAQSVDKKLMKNPPPPDRNFMMVSSSGSQCDSMFSSSKYASSEEPSSFGFNSADEFNNTKPEHFYEGSELSSTVFPQEKENGFLKLNPEIHKVKRERSCKKFKKFEQDQTWLGDTKLVPVKPFAHLIRRETQNPPQQNFGIDFFYNKNQPKNLKVRKTSAKSSKTLDNFSNLQRSYQEIFGESSKPLKAQSSKKISTNKEKLKALREPLKASETETPYKTSKKLSNEKEKQNVPQQQPDPQTSPFYVEKLVPFNYLGKMIQIPLKIDPLMLNEEEPSKSSIEKPRQETITTTSERELGDKNDELLLQQILEMKKILIDDPDSKARNISSSSNGFTKPNENERSLSSKACPSGSPATSFFNVEEIVNQAFAERRFKTLGTFVNENNSDDQTTSSLTIKTNPNDHNIEDLRKTLNKWHQNFKRIVETKNFQHFSHDFIYLLEALDKPPF